MRPCWPPFITNPRQRYGDIQDVKLSFGGAAVSDILSQGKDRDPRGGRWRLIAVAASIAAVAAVLIVLHFPGQWPVTGQPAKTATAANPAPSGRPESVPAARMPPDKPAMMAGRPLPRGTTLWLPLGGHQPAWLSVATGRTEPIRGLPRRRNGYQLIRIAGGWAAQPFPVTNASCAACGPGRLPVYYFADGSRTAGRVGAADFIAPAATVGALWLVSYRPGADPGVAAGTAQEVSITGSALGPRLTLPAGYVIDQATRAGLLLVPEVPGPGALRYELWDPGTRRVMRSFENVIAASPAEIAWMPGCTAACRVHVLDLPAGRAGAISLPGRSQAYEGAFSPDGRLLALLVTSRIGAGGRAAATRLVVAVVTSGRLMAVPGTTVGSGRGVDFGWQAGSRRLVADVSLPHGWQIAVWRPGEARLSVALARAPSGSWPVSDEGPY
jgi:hypothetical protein